MRGVTPSLRHMSSGRGVKRRDNFTFTLRNVVNRIKKTLSLCYGSK